MTRPTFTLPVLPTETVADWHGFTPSGALAAPEPDAPQGRYALGETPAPPPVALGVPQGRVELLAPAGGPDAAFAAFHYGADAVYLGLKKFSARAEAENFTLEELTEVVAYAHSLTPKRRVFVAINTVIRNDEIAELVEALAELDAIGVDALIIQDLGVYHLVRKHFPALELHASTQLAVHNRAGAEALHRLGFARVVLARELTFEEVHDITASAGVETEVFIHGALCYSYSGLCLFSAQTLGRSGNRGKCSYSCRDSYEIEGAPNTLRDGTPVRQDPATGFPFSMKDLALPDHLPALRSAGVSCFKIEGRKKSPLYVATTTDYYRKLLDGTLDESQRPDYEADLQTVFSRPWTRLFLDSHKDKEVADRDTVGHRGSVIGKVLAVVGDRGTDRLRFRTSRAIERHDGLQVDLPILAKPFGFAVDRMWQFGKRAEAVFEAPANSLVEVELPLDHPVLPVGAPVYCSSSQSVKRRFRHDRPRPGFHRTRNVLTIDITLSPTACVVVGKVEGVEVRRELAGTFGPARDAAGTEAAVRTAFEKLGDTALTLEALALHNPDGLFVPASRLNALRRDLTTAVEAALVEARKCRVEAILRDLRLPLPMPTAQPFRWSVKVDRIGCLDAFTAEDWADVDEVIIDITRDHPTLLAERLAQLAAQLGPERVRLALPPLSRKWEENGLLHKIHHLREAGHRRWEAGNVSAWTYLGLDPTAPTTGEIDLATDWSVYAINRVAARQLLGMGVSRFALSPEDGIANLRPMFAEFGERAVLIVYQDTPMFLAESCAYANLIGGCPGKAACKFESMDMVSSHGERVTAFDYHCRTIVLNQGPFCLSPRLRELAKAGARSLRVDFIYRPYTAEDAVARWRAVRAGRPVPGGHAANFDRGIS
jgi:U32 family peptidase